MCPLRVMSTSYSSNSAPHETRSPMSQLFPVSTLANGKWNCTTIISTPDPGRRASLSVRSSHSSCRFGVPAESSGTRFVVPGSAFRSPVYWVT